MKYFLFAALGLMAAAQPVLAAEQLPFQPLNDCVIQSFDGDYVAHTDSSLEVTETIGYDCGTVPGKHGVFRVLPTKESTKLKDGHPDRTAVSLRSIADGSGKAYPYTTKRTYDTVAWQIGDPDVTISGKHTYVISYVVSNALAYGQGGEDGLIWNVVGHFWDLPINSARATVHLPVGVSQANATVSLFSGVQGAAGNPEGATYVWIDSSTLLVAQNSPLGARTGVTLSVLFPTGIITPYVTPIWLLLAEWGSVLLALLILWRAYVYWSRYGRDPRVSRVIAPEFAPPPGFTPAELKSLDESMPTQADFFSCTLIDLAVRGYVRLETIPKKKGLFTADDTRFVLLGKDGTDLQAFERMVLTYIFDGQSESLLSEVKARLSSKTTRPMNDIAGLVRAKVQEVGLIDRDSLRRQGMLGALTVLCLLAGLGALIGLMPYNDLFIYVGVALLTITPFLAVLTFLMPRRTPEGAALELKVRGFKLYMKKAEQYRQQFNEKEGIFDKYLPYAIAFGLTGYWIAAMKSLGGAAATGYAPIWWVGYPGGFSFDSLQSQIGSISSSVSTAIAAANASSGSGGGFSGGGGGGGGGSW